MTFERLPVQFDIDLLKSETETLLKGIPPHMQGPAYGGWTLLSSDGSIYDGWQHWSQYYQNASQGTVFDESAAKECGQLKKNIEFSKPTPLCMGYVREIIFSIQRLGLYPRRARLALLKAGGETSLHQDALESQYSVRLHLPIITNADCFFEYEDERGFMAADGSSYLVWVNRPHRAVNRGTSDRIHLVMNVYDIHFITKFHRFPQYKEPHSLDPSLIIPED